MIELGLNKSDFEYDIRSLIKAFFPKEELKVKNENGGIQREGLYDDKYLKINVMINGKNLTVTLLEGEQIILDQKAFVKKDERKEVKNCLKRLLYRVLEEYTKKSLPWGTLTGIRPTKISMALLEEGQSKDTVLNHVKETYLISPEKAELMIDVAEYELGILKRTNYEEGYSIYIGIPFCPTNCLYCSFTSYPYEVWKPKIDSYIEALYKEIRYVADACRGKRLYTVYIGGGTPTTLEPCQMDELLTRLEECFDYSCLEELTVEAGRPDSITREKLEVLKKHKVSRISINPQTMNQDTLDIIGRKHTVEQTTETYVLARSLGFDNINMDLIVGLPGEDIKEVQNTMEEIFKLNPDSITVHSLAVKRAARLNIWKEKYEDLKMVNTQEMIELTGEYARKMGMNPYYLYRQKNMAGNFENVGYAKPEKEGIYNILIMEEKQSIIALGAGASTKLVFKQEGRIERVENVKDVLNYINRIDEMIERKRKYL